MDQRIVEIEFYAVLLRMYIKLKSWEIMDGLIELLPQLEQFDPLVVHKVADRFFITEQGRPSIYETTVVLQHYLQWSVRMITTTLQLGNSRYYEILDIYQPEDLDLVPTTTAEEQVHIKAFLRSYYQLRSGLT